MSLVGYKRQRNPTWTISGTGAQFETDVRLSDGNPAVLTTFRWLSAGSPATTDYVALRADFAQAIVPWVAMIQGLRTEAGTFPEGVLIRIFGKRSGDSGYPYDLGGNSQTARTGEFSDGDIGIVWVFDDDLDPIIGYEVRIYNDDNGSTWADDETYPQVGEVDVWQAVEASVAPGYSGSLTLTTERDRTLDSQIHEVDRIPYRECKFVLQSAVQAAFRGGGLTNGTDWEKVRAALARAESRALVVLYPNDDAQRSAIFGIATADQFVHVENSGSRRMLGGGWLVQQVPALTE